MTSESRLRTIASKASAWITGPCCSRSRHTFSSWLYQRWQSRTVLTLFRRLATSLLAARESSTHSSTIDLSSIVRAARVHQLTIVAPSPNGNGRETETFSKGFAGLCSCAIRTTLCRRFVAINGSFVSYFCSFSHDTVATPRSLTLKRKYRSNRVSNANFNENFLSPLVYILG